MTSEVVQILKFTQYQSLIEIFLIFIRMGNIERRFEHERAFCHLQGLVLDRYTLGENMLFKQVLNVFAQRNSLKTNRFMLMVKKN